MARRSPATPRTTTAVAPVRFVGETILGHARVAEMVDPGRPHDTAHLVSVATREGADRLARLLDEAAALAAMPGLISAHGDRRQREQIVFAVARALGFSGIGRVETAAEADAEAKRLDDEEARFRGAGGEGEGGR